LEISFGAILNARVFLFDETATIVSTSISIAVVVMLFVFPALTFALIYDKRVAIADDHEVYLNRFGTMYTDFKTKKQWYTTQYYPIFMVRRLLFVLLLILLIDYPEIQINTLILSCSLVSHYFIFIFNTTFIGIFLPNSCKAVQA
jgi:hypothetical protein